MPSSRPPSRPVRQRFGRSLFPAVCTLVMLVALGVAFLLLTGVHPLPSHR